MLSFATCNFGTRLPKLLERALPPPLAATATGGTTITCDM
ncbi:hypothetical protein BRADI_1g44665v3 [Brachypodium distachyon]|uniref:Uncharacterized protein n=1 Tax=Brachypodium distachyon TaxID=15368 RepID=A0A0Q3JM42_BRADI|nr:hypothetical protein BRADI_1g44665v3 [Brachypodium distachyon]